MVPLPKLLDGDLDVLHASLLPHRLGGEVAVGARTVPVPIDGLGVEGDHKAEVLRDPLENISAADDGFTIIILESRASPHTWPSRGHHPWRFPRRGPPGTPTALASPQRWCR